MAVHHQWYQALREAGLDFDHALRIAGRPTEAELAADLQDLEGLVIHHAELYGKIHALTLEVHELRHSNEALQEQVEALGQWNEALQEQVEALAQRLARVETRHG